MGADDKISAGVDKVKGQAKEAYGKVTGDDEKVAEGKMDQISGDLKGAAEQAKDAVKKLFDK